MKKIVTFSILSAMLVSGLSASVCAKQVTSTSTRNNTKIEVNGKAAEEKEEEEIQGIKVYINDERMDFSVDPYMDNNTVMVPMSEIFKELGSTVEYNAKTKVVTAKKGTTVIELKAGTTTASINGEGMTLNAPVQNKEGHTMVPVRFVSEALDADVRWDKETQTVDIEKKVYSTYRTDFESKANAIEQYMEDKLDKATTQLQINKETTEVAKKWENLRKDLYNHLKATLPSSKAAQLEKDENEWAVQKKTAVDEESARYDEGTAQTAAANMVAIDMTQKHCYELIDMVE